MIRQWLYHISILCWIFLYIIFSNNNTFKSSLSWSIILNSIWPEFQMLHVDFVLFDFFNGDTPYLYKVHSQERFSDFCFSNFSQILSDKMQSHQNRKLRKRSFSFLLHCCIISHLFYFYISTFQNKVTVTSPLFNHDQKHSNHFYVCCCTFILSPHSCLGCSGIEVSSRSQS